MKPNILAMGNVSRPLIGLLVATVALFAVWTVALKPSSSPQSARPGPTPARPGSVTLAKSATRPAAAVRHVVARPARNRLDAVSRALTAHKVLALLFYNPAATDDQAVKHELAAVPPHGRAVFKLAVPLTELTRYTVLTSQVPVNVSPTLVLIDRHRRASAIVGFADRFEIEQRVLDAVG